MLEVRRGDLFWVDFGATMGSEQGGKRPALVVQNDMGIIDFNHDDLVASDSRHNDPTYNGGTNKAAITFEFKNCYRTTYRMHNSEVNNYCIWKSISVAGILIDYWFHLLERRYNG